MKKLCNLLYTTSIKQRLKSDRNIKCYYIICSVRPYTSPPIYKKIKPDTENCLTNMYAYIVHCPTYPRVACPRVPSGESMNRDAIYIDEIGQKGLSARHCKILQDIARYCKTYFTNNLVDSQLGTRDNCCDNATWSLGRKMLVIALLCLRCCP